MLLLAHLTTLRAISIIIAKPRLSSTKLSPSAFRSLSFPQLTSTFTFTNFQSRRYSPTMAATEESLRKSLADKLSAVESQGNTVRSLKASAAPKPDIEAAVQALNALKLEKSSIEKSLQSLLSGTGSDSREAFRQAVVNTLERRLFYIPSFKIYRGVAGLYDYGPPGCSVKSNVLSYWRQHFVLEENMLEVDCPCVTPEVVLKASGHVEKFTDLMVKDEKTGTCYRADHLLKDYCNEKLQKDLTLSANKAAELKHVLAMLDDFSSEELGAKIKEYGITAPETKNPLSDPYPFNLMFQTSIGPSGLAPGFMRPETAQGIFVNFKDLYYYNGNKLPFAAAQIGQAFRNEISPRQGLLRVREFTLAEIEHFVDPEDKSHPKYPEVADLEFFMFPREEQMTGQSAKRIRLGEAVSKGIVNNETLGYFIGRVYLFLTRLGIDNDRLRFRQHLANEMAHYAADCWDAEIECSYGWIECVGIADRSAYDLRAHSEKSGVPLVAHEKFSEPKEVEKLVVTPIKKELGLAFKGNQKKVIEALEAMHEKEALDMKAALEAKGEVEFEVCTLGKAVTINKNMVTIHKEKKKEHQRVFTPSVIELSFGIGRIIYCLFEHTFYLRSSKAGDEQLNFEGAATEGGREPSIWDTFTHRYPEKIKDKSNGDIAIDTYHNYKEDVGIMKDMNLDSYRFSISWSRILPKGKLSGGINQEGINYYNNLINELLANGIQPLLTLFHWDLPQRLEDEYGGFLSPLIIKDFQDYAELCFKEFGDRVKYWVTLNEPWSYSQNGYANGRMAPGRCSSWLNPNCTGGDSAIEPYLVTHYQLLAHAAAVHAYKIKYQPSQKGVIGITMVANWFLPLSDSKSDQKAAERAIDFMYGWFMDPLTYGDYPKSMRSLVGARLPKFTTKQSRQLMGSFDFIGLNYYSTTYASDAPLLSNSKPNYLTDSLVNSAFERNGKPIGIKIASDWLYVYPRGIRDLLLYTKEKYNNPLMYITENGINEYDDPTLSVQESLLDTFRIDYHYRHLFYLRSAIMQGANVKGYYVWSLFDNFEWSSGYTVRFGMTFVDYKKDLKRYKKLSALWFKSFLKKETKLYVSS